MTLERFKGTSFECGLDSKDEYRIEIALITEKSIDLTFTDENNESYHFKATSSDGCDYVGKWTYARVYEGLADELGEAILRLYRAADRSALLCGNYHDHENRTDGRWVIELTLTGGSES